MKNVNNVHSSQYLVTTNLKRVKTKRKEALIEKNVLLGVLFFQHKKW